MQRVRQVDVGETEVKIPTQKVLAQIAQGAVKITYGELRQASPPGTFTAESDRDGALIEIPLHEIPCPAWIIRSCGAASQGTAAVLAGYPRTHSQPDSRGFHDRSPQARRTGSTSSPACPGARSGRTRAASRATTTTGGGAVQAGSTRAARPTIPTLSARDHVHVHAPPIRPVAAPQRPPETPAPTPARPQPRQYTVCSRPTCRLKLTPTLTISFSSEWLRLRRPRPCNRSMRPRQLPRNNRRP